MLNEVASSDDVDPAAQATQVEAPELEYLPGVHAMQLGAAAAEAVPAAHVIQKLVPALLGPSVAEYRPAAQSVQLSASPDAFATA